MNPLSYFSFNTFLVISVAILYSEQSFSSGADDWVELNSGEILRGELISSTEHTINSYESALVFDSEDLGEQEIDFEDIDVLHTARFFNILLTSGERISGLLTIQDDTLSVHGSKVQEIELSDIVSIYKATNNEADKWSSELFLGLNINKGNTDESSFAVVAETERKSVRSRLLLQYLANIAQSNGEQSANNHLFDASYDMNISAKIFFRPLKFSIDSDEFQNIDYRINASTQFGYFILTSPATEWDISIGPGVQYTKFKTIPVDAEKHTTSPTALVSSRFSSQLTDNIEISHVYDVNWAKSSAGGIRHTNNLGLDFEVLDDLDFSLKFIWDYSSNPQSDASNVTPEKSDYRLHFGMSYEL
ncbi:DUF481 domain-containing protein [Vibrio paucivorans]|uniref:DUF481 domain-containing protein n=1 Tax=Vibrio paucivorans TaxID=2829489 RepID=A0A9X3CEP1_9VIBR|nr:DUF481 domain-containing protein [Vibrio paucivorans]MCW8334442.1 DUF481 domain-containing protein [Vibrio paucivorans]